MSGGNNEPPAVGKAGVTSTTSKNPTADEPAWEAFAPEFNADGEDDFLEYDYDDDFGDFNGLDVDSGTNPNRMEKSLYDDLLDTRTQSDQAVGVPDNAAVDDGEKEQAAPSSEPISEATKPDGAEVLGREPPIESVGRYPMSRTDPYFPPPRGRGNWVPRGMKGMHLSEGQPTRRMSGPSSFPYPPVGVGNKIHINPAKLAALQAEGMLPFIPSQMMGRPPPNVGMPYMHGPGGYGRGPMPVQHDWMPWQGDNVHRHRKPSPHNAPRPTTSSANPASATGSNKREPQRATLNQPTAKQPRLKESVSSDKVGRAHASASTRTGRGAVVTVSSIASGTTKADIEKLGAEVGGFQSVTVQLGTESVDVEFDSAENAKIFRRKYHKTELKGSRIEISLPRPSSPAPTS
ncbi:hypothetical protein BC832DRAFT_591818 [Gaertneriomyces semiglobifer]|nr:hypothetical protein BC832DRAFT_591818 [Gaertneriomyces semiglobifer]